MLSIKKINLEPRITMCDVIYHKCT